MMCEADVIESVEDMIDGEMEKSSADLDKVADLRNALELFSGVGTSCTVDGLWEIVARRGLYDMAHCLLEKGCREGFRYSTEYDAVMEAVAANDLRMLRLLVENSWELNNVTNGSSESALTIAATNGNAEIFFFLVEKGAMLCNRYRDYELTCDPEGEEHVIDEGDLLSCAIEGKSEQIIRFLAPRCGDLTHWWPRIFPSALANAEVRAWIDSLGINTLSQRIRNFYNE